MISPIVNKIIYNKLIKLCNTSRTPTCPVCNELIRESDAKDSEYVKTKRSTEIFIHTECVKRW